MNERQTSSHLHGKPGDNNDNKRSDLVSKVDESPSEKCLVVT